MKRDGSTRRNIDNRWQGMLERAVQTGRWLDPAGGSSRIREQILSDFHHTADGLGPQVLSILKSVNKDLSVLLLGCVLSFQYFQVAGFRFALNPTP
ncbi:unnamed protein product [Symbiodinium sp. KB8]|nr:unnamed protein product [Symbiodinium sp. KB8]